MVITAVSWVPEKDNNNNKNVTTPIIMITCLSLPLDFSLYISITF